MDRGIYGRKFPPQQIPFQHLTHINYAFANINKESGNVALSDTWADVEVSQKSPVPRPRNPWSGFSSSRVKRPAMVGRRDGLRGMIEVES